MPGRKGDRRERSERRERTPERKRHPENRVPLTGTGALQRPDERPLGLVVLHLPETAEQCLAVDDVAEGGASAFLAAHVLREVGVLGGLEGADREADLA